MIRFHVNVDHVATLRNARGTRYPDPLLAAQLCEHAGADGITCHLREDRRHIRDEDVTRLREGVHTLLNLEMAATRAMTEIAERVRPDVITLVPERREERTTEGGLDILAHRGAIEDVANMCERAGIKLSLFIEADERQIAASRAVGARQVELHTGRYCDAAPGERNEQLVRLRVGARRAHELGLEVAAGHGLSRHNVVDVAHIDHVAELNIGHALVSDAVFVGLEQAVRGFREAINRGLAQRTHPVTDARRR
ncbi:MAG: pyridoxine 5'-phosphate synthase [Polyangiaceae bacterium]